MRIFDANSISVRHTVFVAVASLVFFGSIPAEKVVDKTVASVSDGLNTELITLSDLRWQLVLQPASRPGPYTSEELNAALQTQIETRIFTLEANRLPRNRPISEKELAAAKKEVDDEIKRVMVGLTAAEFESRLREVGFSSVSDSEFQRIMSDRVAIKKFLNFRFRTFIVITADDEETHYREVFAPDFRRRYPGLLMPTLDEKRKAINEILFEKRVESEMDAYLEAAKQRLTIAILSPV